MPISKKVSVSRLCAEPKDSMSLQLPDGKPFYFSLALLIARSIHRYDALISNCAPPKVKAENTDICAIGMQINLDKITTALAAFQSSRILVCNYAKSLKYMVFINVSITN